MGDRSDRLAACREVWGSWNRGRVGEMRDREEYREFLRSLEIPETLIEELLGPEPKEGSE